MSIIATAQIYGRLDDYTVTIEDTDDVLGDGRTAALYGDEFTIEYGSAGTSSRETPRVIGSSIKLTFDDEDGYLSGIFTPPYDEQRFPVSIQGQDTGLSWTGFVSAEFRKRLLSGEYVRERTTLEVFDGIADLADIQGSGIQLQDVLPAQETIEFVVGIGLEARDATDTVVTDPATVARRIFLTDDANPYELIFDSSLTGLDAREAAERVASDFNATVFIGVDGRKYFIDRAYIGSAEQVAVWDGSTWSNGTLSSQSISVARTEHRGTEQDVVYGLREREIIRIDLEPVQEGVEEDVVPLVRNTTFLTYASSTNFPHWTTSGVVEKVTTTNGNVAAIAPMGSTMNPASIEQEVITLSPRSGTLTPEVQWSAFARMGGTTNFTVTIEVDDGSSVTSASVTYPASLGTNLTLQAGSFSGGDITITIRFEGFNVDLLGPDLAIFETNAYGNEKRVTEFLVGDGETISDDEVDTTTAVFATSDAALIGIAPITWIDRDTGAEYFRFWEWQAFRKVAAQPDGADVLETEVLGLHGPEVRLRLTKPFEAEESDFVIGQERRLHLVRGTTEIRDLEISPIAS